MSSEKEAMLAIQFGLQAFCFTAGEGAIDNELLPLFKDFDLGICFDCDEAGQAASDRVQASTCKFARSVTNIQLPFSSPEYKDFADWILFCRGRIKDFLERAGVLHNAGHFNLIQLKIEELTEILGGLGGHKDHLSSVGAPLGCSGRLHVGEIACNNIHPFTLGPKPRGA